MRRSDQKAGSNSDAVLHRLIIFSTANKNLLVSEPESISKFIFLCSISYQMGYGSLMKDGEGVRREEHRREAALCRVLWNLTS